MKTLYVLFTAVLFFTMLIMPVFSVAQKAAEPAVTNNEPKDGIVVFLSDTNKSETVSLADYVFNVTAANLPADTPYEAIKAEAVAARTLALYYKQNRGDKLYDIDDLQDGYITDAKLKEKWGENYSKNAEIFKSAIADTGNKTVMYKNAYAKTLRHDVSGGKTESAKEILGEDIPYLTNVASVGDIMADDYLSTVKFSAAEFTEKLKNAGATDFSNLSAAIGKVEYTAAKGVKTIVLCKKSFKGDEVKNIFSLNSCNFSIEQADGQFTFSVKGKGNMLGMSRAGAKYMATEGSKYVDILSWYYPGCELK